MLKMLIGAIAGAVAVYVWQDEIRRFLDERTRDARVRADGKLERIQHAVDDAIDTAREQVHSTLDAGRDVIRPAAADRPR
ncbi:MAG: hypothetical protein L0027_02360 [Candidatus Rokubacteria bacterium]|nr:hypothetical protein [Candidatus Rokubacteria bacterium]